MSDQTSASALSLGIHHDQATQRWALITAHAAYALGVTPEGLLMHLHWGPSILNFADLPLPRMPPQRSSNEPRLSLTREEYPPAGGQRYREAALALTYADGTRDVALMVAESQISDDTLTITLRDPVYPLMVKLVYQIDTDHDIITRHAEISNEGPNPIMIERALSGTLHLPRTHGQREATTLSGRWAHETISARQPLMPGMIAVGSQRGVASHQAYPYMAISDAQGETYAAILAWSGSWFARLETDIIGSSSLAIGINDHDSAWKLDPQTTFTTPDLIAIFADDGLARQRIHRHVHAKILPTPHRDRPVPVLYNSWEATGFAIEESQQIALAHKAAQIGCEIFVMDDGWFRGRLIDNAGLGDWTPDPAKFPNGLGPLIDAVNNLGMLFGIWVEPEMVNANSDLYRAHPEWAYHFPTRPQTESRNQMVLNVARSDVQDHLIAVLDDLLTTYPQIRFIKWDMNRPFSEPGWPEHPEQGREIWIRHTLGVYHIIDTLRQRHPYLRIESCASGGGRADLGILRRTDQVWGSDNTDADDRLHIQEGLGSVVPARALGAWVTDSPNFLTQNRIPLTFRCHVAMMGALGIGANLAEASEDDLTTMAREIAFYRRYRHLIHNGDQYWLHSWRDDGFAAVAYVAADRQSALLFGFQRTQLFGETRPPMRLAGLSPSTRYRISEGPVMSGAALMGIGLDLDLWGPYASRVIVLEALTDETEIA